MQYQCEIKDQAEQPTLTVRTRTSVEQLPAVLGQAFAAIMQHLGEVGEGPVGPPYVAYFNMNMADLDIEIGFPVSASVAGRGETQPGLLPGGKVATCFHTGPYSEMGPAYEALTSFVKDNGYEPTGTCYEVYLNDPLETDPPDLLTQIVFPVKKS